MAAVDARNPEKEFKGKKTTLVALDGADLQVEPGEIFGLCAILLKRVLE